MLVLSCVFDVAPDWDCLLSHSVRPNTILRNIVASAFFHDNRSILEKATVDAILNVYEAVSQFNYIHQAAASFTSDMLKRVLSVANQDDLSKFILTKTVPLNTADRVNVCCQLCSLMFWKLLKDRTRLESDMPTKMEETELLMDHLMKIKSRYWIQNAPETLIWIIFTGVAASIDEKDRGRFFEIGGTSIAAIDSDSLSLARQGWRYFGLLRRLAGLSSHIELSSGADSS
ncbi:hypothetical protein N7540_010998 [Penicillium herquei]|nr:hypothetical protein N7540_010998 [Penicillium herquei]